MSSPSLTTDFRFSPPQPSLLFFYHTKIAASERKKTLHYEVDNFSHLLFMLQTYTHAHLVMVHSSVRERKLMHLCNMLRASDTVAQSTSSLRWNGYSGLFLVFILIFLRRRRAWKSHANFDLSWIMHNMLYIHWDLLLEYNVLVGRGKGWTDCERRGLLLNKFTGSLEAAFEDYPCWWMVFKDKTVKHHSGSDSFSNSGNSTVMPEILSAEFTTVSQIGKRKACNGAKKAVR